MPHAPRPRLCHLYFAYLALPRMAFANPFHTLGVLGSPHGSEFLDHVLSSVEEHCQAEGESDTLPREEFRIQTARVHRFPCTLVQLPAPRAAPEAYMIAMVLKPPAGDTAEALMTVTPRYFTLEKADASESKSGVRLGECTEDGTHLHHGPGPAPQVEAFLRSLEILVAADH